MKRITGRELTREEKLALKCKIELTLDDIEYLSDALHSHLLLHQELVKKATLVPWEAHTAMLRIGYDGEARASLTKANLDAIGYALRGGEADKWKKSLTSSSE